LDDGLDQYFGIGSRHGIDLAHISSGIENADDAQRAYPQPDCEHPRCNVGEWLWCAMPWFSDFQGAGE